MGTGDRPNRELGPYYIGDNVPDWVWTVTGLVSSAVYNGADLEVDLPDGTDFSVGSDSFQLTVIDTTTLKVTYTADSSKTFTVAGRYRGQLALLIGARRYSVQDFLFDVIAGPSST
jgi:hypothetical protein